MSLLTSAAVLDLWEAGLSMTSSSRAALLLRATEEDHTDDPVGRRNLELLDRYCGDGWAADALADCPACGGVLEVSVDRDSLAAGSAGDLVTVEDDGWTVTARLPTVGDLEAISPSDDLEAIRWFLLERCVVEAVHDGRATGVRDLPDHLVERIEEALDDADPAADIRFPLTCPDCGTSWSETLDPVVFAWSAVEASARRLATDVHTLAQAFGWSERDILDLSPFRRHLYLSAVEP